MVKLLVVDWDSFFRTPDIGEKDWQFYDWGHRESPFFIDGPLWYHRAATFLTNRRPLPGLTGEERKFWRRFDVDPDAHLFTADSNAHAVSKGVYNDVDEVWLYDAHHDAGYDPARAPRLRAKAVRDRLEKGVWDCSDWMILYYGMGARLHVRYPRWKAWALEADEPTLPDRHLDRQVDDGRNGPTTRIDRIFVCRSGAWVPPWLDRQFEKFLRRAPIARGNRVVLEPTPPREFTMQAVEHIATQWGTLRNAT